MNRSDAARKGWETRRAAARAAELRAEARREAALKGWVTRRTNIARRVRGDRRKELDALAFAKAGAPGPLPFGILPAGTEVEASVRYKKQQGRGRVRVLFIKIRARLLEPMTKTEAMKRVKRSVRSARVQAGIDLGWIDWQKGSGYYRQSGEYIEGRALDALVNFHAVIMASDYKRIGVVGESETYEW